MTAGGEGRASPAATRQTDSGDDDSDGEEPDPEEERRRRLWHAVEARRAPRTRDAMPTVRAALDVLQDVVITSVLEQGEDATEGALIVALQNALSDEEQEPVWREMLRSLLERYVPRFGREEIERFEQEHRTVFAETRQEVSEDEWQGRVETWLREDAGDLIHNPGGLAETSRTEALGALREVLADETVAQEGIDSIARALDEQLTGLNRTRAQRIARTEVIRASGMATEEAGLQIEAQGVEILFEWLATPDSRTRETHSAASGQLRRTRGFFLIGGHQARYPADSMLPAGEAVQCRCAMVSVPKEDTDIED